MQKSHEVDVYMRGLSPERNRALVALRIFILETIPAVRETMRYRMPTYELDEVVCSFASQKQYMSLYLDTTLVAVNREAFSDLDVGISWVRFKHLEDLPLGTVRKILVETVNRQSKVM